MSCEIEPGSRLELTELTSYPSKAMRNALEKAHKVAETDCTVLLTGETGSGKGWMAEYIHNHSKRRDQDFFVVDCGTIPPELAESELFGYCKGAHSEAKEEKRGKLEMAPNGTLFLDEIENLSLTLQTKLLRFLDKREITRVGENKARKVDARLIAATNEDLKSLADQRCFRRDLYFRLIDFLIEVPPLRDRFEDLSILIEERLQPSQSQLSSSKRVQFLPETLARLREYGWPGNVREFDKVVNRAILMSPNGIVTPDLLGLPTKPESSLLPQGSIVQDDGPGAESSGESQKRLAAEAVRRFYRRSSEEQRCIIKELFVDVCHRGPGSFMRIAEVLGTTDETIRKELKKATKEAKEEKAEKGRPRKKAAEEMAARIKRYLIEKV